jgi:hypothetical protein
MTASSHAKVRLFIAVVALLTLAVLGLIVVRAVTNPSTPATQQRTASLFGENLFVNIDYPDDWLFTGVRDRFRLYNPNTMGIDSYNMPLTRFDVELLDETVQPLEELARSYTSDLIDTEDTDGLSSDTILIDEPQSILLGDVGVISVSGTRTAGALKLDFLAIYRPFPEYRKIVVIYAQAPTDGMAAHLEGTQRLAQTLSLQEIRDFVSPAITSEITAELTAEVTAEVTAEITPEATPEVTPDNTPESSATPEPETNSED